MGSLAARSRQTTAEALAHHAHPPAWMQDQTRRAADPRSTAARTQRQLSIPTHHLLLQRVAFGLLGVLCSLDATVTVEDEMRRWLPNYA